jgi:serine/threonine protein phosphatase PrpC
MAVPRQLEIRVGWCSKTGRREVNEDYVGACVGSPAQRAQRGAVAAIADGISGTSGGRVAAEVAVRAFIDFYLGERETIGIRRAAANAAAAVNSWIHAQGRADKLRAGMATTLTAMILRGRQAHILHVGDTRAYRLREGRLARLTQDHVHDGPDRERILRRAVGLEDALHADYVLEPLSGLDRLILLSDGVHAVLRDREIARLLAEELSPDVAALRLVAAALDAGSGDDATALILDVVSLPDADHDELAVTAAALPILDPPKSGDQVDGYLISARLSDGPYSEVYRATDALDGRDIVLKFPKPLAAETAIHRLAFVREAWVAARVRCPWLGEVLEPAPGRQTRLYTAMPFYEGETLEQRIRRPPKVALAEGLAIATKLGKAVAALHRAGIIHRDLKPENVILEPGGELRLVDLGVVRLPQVGDFPDSAAPGTPSYMAPELLAGAAGDERSDLYALGVTLYRMFTGAYPYGEIEPFQHPRFGTPAPLQQRRADLPIWLDHALGRAVAARAEDRQGDVIELTLELEAGLGAPGPGPAQRRPLYARNPERFWQVVSFILLALLLLSTVRG